jgi:hypothetical protein
MEPGLNCSNCFHIFNKNHKRPACMAKRCPIADVAPDPVLNTKVRAFMNVESLEMSPGYSEFQKRILRDSGLDEETPDTILELKRVLTEAREYEAKKQAEKAKVRGK